MICPATIGREDTLFIRLVNHAVLLHEAASGADKGPLVRLHDQTVGFAAVLTLVLFHIFLCFRQFVLFCIELSLALIFAILLILFAILLLEKHIYSYVILSSFLVRVHLTVGHVRG